MHYAIAVHGAPVSSHSARHALKFCAAVLARGHAISRVFFYHDGVYTALSTQVAPQGEQDVLAAWQSFSQDHDVELAVCIANAIKRGVLDSAEAQRYDRGQSTLEAPFQLVGLGQLIDAIAQADRYIEFA